MFLLLAHVITPARAGGRSVAAASKALFVVTQTAAVAIVIDETVTLPGAKPAAKTGAGTATSTRTMSSTVPNAKLRATAATVTKPDAGTLAKAETVAVAFIRHHISSPLVSI
jgi:hypothetical protein